MEVLDPERRRWRNAARSCSLTWARSLACRSSGPLGAKCRFWLVDLALQSRGLALREPGVRVDGRGYLLPIRLVGSLQNSMADAEGQGQVGADAPGVLQVVFKLIGLEVAVDEGAIAEVGAGGGAGDLVVVDCSVTSGTVPTMSAVGDLVGVRQSRYRPREPEEALGSGGLPPSQ